MINWFVKTLSKFKTGERVRPPEAGLLEKQGR